MKFSLSYYTGIELDTTISDIEIKLLFPYFPEFCKIVKLEIWQYGNAVKWNCGNYPLWKFGIVERKFNVIVN